MVRTKLYMATLIASPALLVSEAAFAASPADKPFTVANYPVEAQAKNAVAAKERAHADGQQAALRSLLKRIVPVTAYMRMDRLKAVKASDLIDGVAVRSERNSSTEYIASLDFSFQADEVRNLLKREGVPFIDEQAPKAVLVPILHEPGAAQPPAGGSTPAAQFRAATGPWREVWKGLDLENTVTPVGVQALSQTIHADTIAMLMRGDGGAERILAEEYKSETVLAAIAEVDHPAKRLHVTLAGRDAVEPLIWTRSYRIAEGDVGYAMELAAVVTLGVLEGRWKSVKSEAWGGVDTLAGPGLPVQFEVEFGSLPEWNDVRRQIVDMPGVGDVQIGAVSARTAEVTLRYPGGAQPLADAFARQGLSLRDEGGIWVLRAGVQ